MASPAARQNGSFSVLLELPRPETWKSSLPAVPSLLQNITGTVCCLTSIPGRLCLKAECKTCMHFFYVTFVKTVLDKNQGALGLNIWDMNECISGSRVQEIATDILLPYCKFIHPLILYFNTFLDGFIALPVVWDI